MSDLYISKRAGREWVSEAESESETPKSPPIELVQPSNPVQHNLISTSLGGLVPVERLPSNLTHFARYKYPYEDR